MKSDLIKAGLAVVRWGFVSLVFVVVFVPMATIIAKIAYTIAINIWNW